MYMYMKFSWLLFLNEVRSIDNLTPCGAFWVISQSLILSSLILSVPNLLVDWFSNFQLQWLHFNFRSSTCYYFSQFGVALVSHFVIRKFNNPVGCVCYWSLMMLIIWEMHLSFILRLFVRIVFNCVFFRENACLNMPGIPNDCCYPTWKLFVTLSPSILFHKIVKSTLRVLEQKNLLPLLGNCYRKYAIYDVKDLTHCVMQNQ